MKIINRILKAGTMVAALTLVAGAQAGHQVICEDGVVASPKVRQMLNDRQPILAADGRGAASYEPRSAAAPFAPPKVRQMANERVTFDAPPAPVDVIVSYRAQGPDGITASPKVREQLESGPVTIEIAPVR
jgi:hypothetical protein